MEASPGSENHSKRRKIGEVEDYGPGTGMDDLPCELVRCIVSKLPISSLVQFKSVCRSWRAMAQDPQLLGVFLSSTSQKDPCLILHCDSPIRNHLSFADFAAEDERVKRIHLPFWDKMSEFDVVGSCNGLLCLSDSLYRDAVYIYNPFTKSHLELPKSFKYPDQEVVFGFGFHPKTREYKVVKIVYYRNGSGNHHRAARRVSYPQSEVQILRVGSPEWRSLGKVPYRLVRCPSEALVNGRLHWVSKPCRYKPARRLVSFDLEDEQFREVPKPDCGGLNKCNYHLVVLKGNLCAAVYGNYGRLEIWVMKKYNVKESWVKEFNIGSYMPKQLKHNHMVRSCRTQLRWDHNWPMPLNRRVVRVLCLLKNGEVLLEYKNRVLVCYDPKLGKFKDLVLQGLPNWFHAIVHVGTLNWIDTPIDTYDSIEISVHSDK